MIRRLASNFVGLLLVRGFAVLGPLIVMPYLVKTAGLEGWGKISFAIAATSFAGPIVQYGFAISGTADLARLRGDPPKFERAWRDHFVSTLVLAAMVFAAGLSGIAIFEHESDMRLLLVGALLWSVSASIVPVWLLMALERMRPVVISSFVTQLGYAVAVLAIVREPGQAQWVTLIGASAACLGLAISLVQVARDFRLSIPLVARMRDMIALLRRGYGVFLMTFVPLLYNAGGVFLLGVTAAKSEVALLTVPMTIVETAIIVGRLLTNAALAMVATDPAQFRRFARYSLGIGIAAAIAMTAVAPFVATWLAPAHARGVTLIMIVLGLSIPFGFMQLIFGQNYLAIHGHARVASRIVITTSLLGAFLTIAIVPWAGATGAAVVILVARVLLGGRSFLAYRRVTSGLSAS
jgi:O-antigen/teichoic acid export membrane protein